MGNASLPWFHRLLLPRFQEGSVSPRSAVLLFPSTLTALPQCCLGRARHALVLANNRVHSPLVTRLRERNSFGLSSSHCHYALPLPGHLLHLDSTTCPSVMMYVECFPRLLGSPVDISLSLIVLPASGIWPSSTTTSLKRTSSGEAFRTRPVRLRRSDNTLDTRLRPL